MEKIKDYIRKMKNRTITYFSCMSIILTLAIIACQQHHFGVLKAQDILFLAAQGGILGLWLTTKHRNQMLNLFFWFYIAYIPWGVWTGCLNGVFILFQLHIPVLILLFSEDIKHTLFFILYMAVITVSIAGLLLFSKQTVDYIFHGSVNSISISICLLCMMIQRFHKKVYKRLFFLAEIDRRTKLPNRDRFIKDLAVIPGPVVFVIVSIDDFKELNDIYGFRIGDEILIFVGKHLKALFPDWDIFRLSGSDFGLLYSVSEGSPSLYVNEFLTEIEESLEMNLEVDNFFLNIQLSVGIAVEGENHTDRNQLLPHADMALCEARNHHSRFSVYNPENGLVKKLNDKFHWERKLKDGFQDDLFLIYLQPMLNNTTNSVEKYECLARLKDRNGTIYSPLQFLDYMNNSKIRSRFTRTILEKSFASLAQVSQSLSINLSVEDLLDPITREYIFFMLERFSKESFRVQFELLETECINNRQDTVCSILEEMKSRNCKIAIDDFGSGYSNFDYLTKLKVDCVKIDGSLIRNICGDYSAYSMVRNIVNICRDMNLEVVAEFVSDFSIHMKVKELGILYSQGYYIGKPAIPDFYRQADYPMDLTSKRII